MAVEKHENIMLQLTNYEQKGSKEMFENDLGKEWPDFTEPPARKLPSNSCETPLGFMKKLLVVKEQLGWSGLVLPEDDIVG